MQFLILNRYHIHNFIQSNIFRNIISWFCKATEHTERIPKNFYLHFSELWIFYSDFPKYAYNNESSALFTNLPSACVARAGGGREQVDRVTARSVRRRTPRCSPRGRSSNGGTAARGGERALGVAAARQWRRRRRSSCTHAMTSQNSQGGARVSGEGHGLGLVRRSQRRSI